MTRPPPKSPLSPYPPLSRPPGNEPAVLLEVVGLVDGVEGHGCVEVREQDDEDALPEYVMPAIRAEEGRDLERERVDRKSTRLNSSHSQISYAVFCLKKKKK